MPEYNGQFSNQQLYGRDAYENQQQPSQSNFPQAPYVQPGPTTLEGSAMANIDLQKAQLAKIEELTAPYRQAGINTALPNLSALAFGGNVDYQPSQLFKQQLDQGQQGVLRGQAAGGAGVKSSRTFERLVDLVSGLAGEDLGRFEQGNQSLLNQGITATNQLGQAGSQLTGNVSNIYSNLGQGVNLAAQQRAQGQIARGQTINSGLSGLGQLAMTAPVSTRIDSYFGGN